MADALNFTRGINRGFIFCHSDRGRGFVRGGDGGDGLDVGK